VPLFLPTACYLIWPHFGRTAPACVARPRWPTCPPSCKGASRRG